MPDTNERDNSLEGPVTVRTAQVPCNLCGRSDSEFLFEARDRLHGIPGTFRYVRCRNCGLVYMNPQIVPEDLARVYPLDYGPHHAADKERRTQQSLKAELRRTPFVLSLCAGCTEASRVLDVGCGAGAFLHKVRDLTGCAVYGVDNSEAAAAAARTAHGIDVFCGDVLDAPFPDGFFDAVTAWSFLEHVPNPRQVLRRISQLLKSGGHCIVGVPNTASFNARVFRDRWYHLDCPRHLHLFSPETLTKLMQQADLVVDGLVFDKGSRSLVRSIRYRFGDDTVPLKYRRTPAGMSALKAALRPVGMLLGGLGQSDVMVMRARKDSTT
jgi:SAM-dependent methyltransferase